MHQINIKELQKHLEAAYSACTWGNTKEKPEDWLNILVRGNENEKKRLFRFLFREDPVESRIQALFTKEQIRHFLAEMDRKEGRAWVEKRRKVWRFLYCGIREPILELDWIVK